MRKRNFREALHPGVDAPLPKPINLRNSYYFTRHDVENFKRVLMELEPLPVDPNAPVLLVKLATFAAEIGYHPVSLKRLIPRPAAPAPAAPVKRRARSLEEV